MGGTTFYPIFATGIRYFQNGCLVTEDAFYRNAGSRANPNVYEYHRYCPVGEALHCEWVCIFCIMFYCFDPSLEFLIWVWFIFSYVDFLFHCGFLCLFFS